MCDEFMVCGCMQVSSDNVLNRAVCGEESRVMFIEGVPPLPCGIVSAVRRLRKKRNWALQLQRLISTSNSRRALSQFCVANPLQVRMALATEIVLCFSSPLCCQNPSLCRMADGANRMKRLRWNAVLRSDILNVWSNECLFASCILYPCPDAEGQIAMDFCCRRGWIL